MRSTEFNLIILFLMAATIVAAMPVTAQARQDLTENELEETTASGSEFPFIGPSFSPLSSAPAHALEAPVLVLNNVIGENEVITRLLLELVGGDVPAPGQENVVTQRVGSGDGENRDIENKGRLVIDSDFTLRELALRDLLALVVNNVFGANRVETSINVRFGGASRVGTPFRALGETAASAGSASAQNSPVKTGADTIFSGPIPTTVQGAIPFLEALVPKFPELAPDLAELRRIDQTQSRLQQRFSVPSPTSISQPVK